MAAAEKPAPAGDAAAEGEPKKGSKLKLILVVLVALLFVAGGGVAVGVFLLGIFVPAASAMSAKWTMWLGSLMGAALFGLKTLHAWQPTSFGWVPGFIYETPFMMMAFYMFAVCVVLQIGLLAVFPKQSGEAAHQLYWPKPLDALAHPGWPASSYRRPASPARQSACRQLIGPAPLCARR